PESQHVHGVLGVEAVHLLQLRTVDPLLSPLTRQALLLRLQVAEERALNPPRDDRRRERPQLGAELVAVHQLLLRREQEQHDRWVALEREASPLPQAVDRQVKIAGGASRVVTPLAFGGRAVDELLEWSPERHRLFERLDTDTHLVAVLNPVVHIKAVNCGAD